VDLQLAPWNDIGTPADASPDGSGEEAQRSTRCDPQTAAAPGAIRPQYAHEQALRPPLIQLVSTLVYELLDAHADTADLAAELAADPAWGAHLEYLRALQREGRAALAQIALGMAV
jgi:hypothetical protein